MKGYPYIKQTKREFIREKCAALSSVKKNLRVLKSGCALWTIFGTSKYQKAVREMERALEKMNKILRPLA